MLVMLWTVARYAHNDMDAMERGEYLQNFDASGSLAKIGLINTSIEFLQLRSSHLDELLQDLQEGWKWRYAPRRRKASKEELQKAKVAMYRLESHEWVMDTLRVALQNVAWGASLDPAKQQEVPFEALETGKKRKSQCSEYSMRTK